MPTILTHALAGFVVSDLIRPRSTAIAAAAAMCAMLPDVDVASFALGVPYDNVLGHRGLTHSMAFAAVVGLAALGKGLSVYLAIFAATISHGLLDAVTDGGLGVAFLAPFSSERFFFWWRPIQVSPIGFGFFSARGAAVLASEILWAWLPAVAFWLIGKRLWRLSSQHRAQRALRESSCEPLPESSRPGTD